MRIQEILTSRTVLPRSRNALALALLIFALSYGPLSQAQEDVAPAQVVSENSQAEHVLDRVIAVVNNQVILASDLTLEMKIYRLLPIGDPQDAAPVKALERLTTRALIEQQILQEDPQGLEIAPKDLDESLSELRANLPDCKRRDCTTPAGWATYLATLDLTPERVANYWSNRMALLRFIERRFRAGIRISPEEIQKYYQETLVPRYAKPEDAPKLDRVSPRIQEILLQQDVNALLSDWLKSLQNQGQVEILDASLRGAAIDPVASPAAPVESPVVPVRSLPNAVQPAGTPSQGGGTPSTPSSTTPPLGMSGAFGDGGFNFAQRGDVL